MKICSSGRWIEAQLVTDPPWRGYVIHFLEHELVNWWTMVGMFIGPSVFTEPLIDGRDHAWFSVGRIT